MSQTFWAVLDTLAYFLMLGMLGTYFITTMQWFNYRLERALLHHTRAWWNFAYFVLPFFAYEAAFYLGGRRYAWIVVVLYGLFFTLWYRNLDKKLVLTGRIKRFFVLLALTGLLALPALGVHALLLPMLLAFGISVAIERILFAGFKRRARRRLDSMKDLTVVGVTASYGKTSIKNFLNTILSVRYRSYATPRSVNTLGGVLKDINEDLPQDTEVYVVEMGARAPGDIAQISEFVRPHYAVVGTLGPAHIEYFKSLERIRDTKMEIVRSDRIRHAWVHESARVQPTEKISVFGPEITEVEATLEGTSFTLDGERYCSKILGAFNAVNLAAAIHVARAMGLSREEIREGLNRIEPVPHRLQRIDAGGKVILDDSFNGNIDGMLASFELASGWSGRKILVTPGLVEADEALNEQVARRADEIFDRIIVTGDLNYGIFKKTVAAPKLLHLQRKSEMQSLLAQQTRSGDLILFANDAPNFV